MAQPPAVIDAPASTTVRFGTPVVTFSASGVLVAETIRYGKGRIAIRQKDKDGLPLKAAYLADWGEGSATIQLKNSTTKIAEGETLTFLDTDNSTTITGIVTKIGPSWTNDAATKIDIDFAEKVNV